MSRGAGRQDTPEKRAALVPVRRVRRLRKFQLGHRAGGKLSVEHVESLLFAPAGQIQRQFLQGRIMSDHHDVAGVLRQRLQALQHGPRTECVEPPHHVDVEIGGKIGQDTAHRLHRPASGGTENPSRSASHGRQFLAHRGRVFPASGGQSPTEIVGGIRPGLGMPQQPQALHAGPPRSRELLMTPVC